MFTLEQVVPWGRSFDEYRRMFSLDDRALDGSLLGCGDGPASFNAEATKRGARVVSCDPLYRFDVGAIRRRISETRDQIVEQARQNMDEFVWDEVGSLEQLAKIRHAAMQTFLDDFNAGRSQGRYLDASLPSLPFADRSFDIALCSHLLFLYSEQLDESFHVSAITELCRVASEVRVFPLVSLGGSPSRHLEPVRDMAQRLGLNVSVRRVDYEFQRGANEMLVVNRARLTARTTASWRHDRSGA